MCVHVRRMEPSFFEWGTERYIDHLAVCFLTYWVTVGRSPLWALVSLPVEWGSWLQPSWYRHCEEDSQSQRCSQLYDFGTAGGITINRKVLVPVLGLQSVMYCCDLMQKGMVLKSTLRVMVLPVRQRPRSECYQIRVCTYRKALWKGKNF